MNKELRGTIKTLQDNPLVKSGSYEFIGDSNITYADIYILLEFIRNQEQENKKYKEVIDKIKNICDKVPYSWSVCGIEVVHKIEKILKEVEHE